MKEEILKPMSIARHEFIQSLTNLINESMLPPFILESVLKDVYTDMKILSQRQLEIDVKKYKESLINVEGE